jgi:choline dehydrogenase-like flavoprotein
LLIDLNESQTRRFGGDICVIGTGAAGLTLASVLLQSGVSVIMLESGGFDSDRDANRLNVVETDRWLLFQGAQRGRRRGLGGSTACWGGQLLPLEPIDFAPRAWVDHSGWPITAEDLAPYYRLALQFAGADERNFDSDVSRLLGRQSPFDPRVFSYFFSKWSPHPRFRDLLAEDLRQSTDVRVFLHATVTRIELDNGGDRVREVRASNAAQEEFVFTAETIVLCTGGIETPRLLLANRHQAPRGIGNGHDLVGRFFQDHPNVRVGTVRSAEPQRMHELFSPATVDGLDVTPQLSLAPEVQEKDGLLNASAHVWFRYPRTLLQRLSLLNLVRRIGAEPNAARNLVDAGLLLSGPTIRMLRQGARLGEEARFTITVIVEQEPSPESRITLASRTDRFGVPRAKVRWQLTDKTWGTVVRVSRALESQFRQVGLGTLDIFPHIATDRTYWNVFPHDANHHMGGTRMASSPDAGVVDENCRVFGVENLFVASSSVFPTGGHSNCTLTIMALALRLAEHLGISPHAPGKGPSVDARVEA